MTDMPISLTSILFTLIIGLAGALLMFAGDMLLYYDRNDFIHDGTLQPIIDIMKKLPARRVMLGGPIGPIAAFLYCIGFYHMVLISDPSSHTLAFIGFLSCCLGIIAGGAYHSHCAYLGLLGQDEQKDDLKIVTDYFQKLPLIMYLFEGIGLLILIFLFITRKTILPARMFLITPGVLFLFRSPARKLPKGLHMILCGGFTNVIFIIYYLIMVILFVSLI